MVNAYLAFGHILKKCPQILPANQISLLIFNFFFFISDSIQDYIESEKKLSQALKNGLHVVYEPYMYAPYYFL